MDNKMELILHPIRMKIIQTLIGGRKLTSAQIGERLPDTPQATLYRHLSSLLKGGVIIVAEQKKFRGTVEKVYALSVNNVSLSKDEIATLTKEEHMSLFTSFTTLLLQDFQNYLQKEGTVSSKDTVGYKQAYLHLTDEECFDFINELREVIEKRIGNEPSDGRKLIKFSTIFIPDKN